MNVVIVLGFATIFGSTAWYGWTHAERLAASTSADRVESTTRSLRRASVGAGVIAVLFALMAAVVVIG